MPTQNQCDALSFLWTPGEEPLLEKRHSFHTGLELAAIFFHMEPKTEPNAEGGKVERETKGNQVLMKSILN